MPGRLRPLSRILLAQAIIWLLAFVPVIALLAPVSIASYYGCSVNEGAPQACVIGGHDYGETLYHTAVTGWMVLISLPVGAALSAMALVVELALALRRWFRGKDYGGRVPATTSGSSSRSHLWVWAVALAPVAVSLTAAFAVSLMPSLCGDAPCRVAGLEPAGLLIRAGLGAWISVPLLALAAPVSALLLQRNRASYERGSQS